MGASIDFFETIGNAATLGFLNQPKAPKAPKEVGNRANKESTRTLQSAKSRKERMKAARGRSSFRIQLADADPKQTRSGISLG